MPTRTAESADLDIETVRAILQDYPVRLAILFGSHATGTTHTSSDIDIAVEFGSHRPSDPGYNDTFFGLSADLSETLRTDDVDLVDFHTLSPAVAKSIFDHGVLLVGNREHADELRQQLTTTGDETQSPRERLDAALAKIDAHLEDSETEVPATGDAENDR